MNKLKAGVLLIMVGVGMILGVIGENKIEQMAAPVVYAKEEVIQDVKPREVRIKIDYTGWSKARIQKEIRDNLPEVFIKIAECESTTRQYDNRHEPLKGLVDADDTGVMQINKRYHLKTAQSLGHDLDTPVGNIAFAAHLYQSQGLQPWSASKHCWSK